MQLVTAAVLYALFVTHSLRAAIGKGAVTALLDATLCDSAIQVFKQHKEYLNAHDKDEAENQTMLKTIRHAALSLCGVTISCMLLMAPTSPSPPG